VDGEKLLAMLLRYWGGERRLWQVVRVPTPEAEDARHASRSLTTLQAERTRYRNRIHSLLALVGVTRLRVDARLPARLAQVRDWADQPLGRELQARVLESWRLLQAVEGERRARRRAERARVAAGATRAAAIARQLGQVRGLAARTATILSDELFTRDLRNRRQVGGLSGLVSAPYQSGETRRDQGLMRSGLPAVRRVAMQLAWGWLRYQPTSALSRWYQTRFGHGGPGMRRLGIVALARRLLIALWRYVATGVVPEGAVLKA
jgi:transposase